MKAKLGAALLCLVFAIPFGGIGAGAAWVLGRMLYDGHRAEDWVRVKAIVDSYNRGSVRYRYTFDGVEHRGDRLGANPIGGTDDVDSWHDDISALMSAAQDGSKPLTVWVNPDNPAESMVDRTIRWKLAAFIVPFAFGFGGVGLVALWIFFRTLLRPSAEAAAQIDPVAPARAFETSRPAAADGFARGMITDKGGSGAEADVIDTTDVGMPPAVDKILNARQREALAKLSPEQRAKVEKLAGFLGKFTQD